MRLILLTNTCYIFIDLTRIQLNWSSINYTKDIILLVQYIILGIIGLATYLVSFIPWEKLILQHHLLKHQQILTIILFNLHLAFGMVLGRTYFINSYIIFTQPIKIIFYIISLLTSINFIELIILFGAIINIIYFTFRPFLLKKTNAFLQL